MVAHRKIGRPKLRWGDVIRRHEGESSRDRRSARPENVEIENLMCRPKTGRRLMGKTYTN